MIENKVLVSVNVPSLEQKFDMYIPVNRKVYSVIGMIENILLELSLGSFEKDAYHVLYNGLTGQVYDMNLMIRDTDIRNGSNVILL